MLTFRVETIIVIINIIYSLTMSIGLAISPPGHEQIYTRVFPCLTTMDLQGKGFWLNMVLHNGAFGCLDCYTKGYHVKSGKGYAHCYPYSEYKKSALRTSQQFKEDAVKAQQTNKTVSYNTRFWLH